MCLYDIDYNKKNKTYNYIYDFCKKKEQQKRIIRFITVIIRAIETYNYN